MASKRRFSIKCRVTKPFLGARKTKSGTRTFDTVVRGDKTYIEVDTAKWRWAIREAFDSMGIIPEVDIDYVRLPTEILAPAIRPYIRIWDPKKPGGRESFDSIQAGTVFTVPVFILSELEQSVFNGIQIESRPPTQEELLESFSIIGENIGLSPWGSKFGYGRFIVESIE